MTRVQHATTAPISDLDWCPFLGAPRVRLERMVLSLTDPPGRAQHINYLEPAGNPGIFGPDSVSWRVLSNPVTVFIGGGTAALFELARARRRSGAWEHTDFR